VNALNVAHGGTGTSIPALRSLCDCDSRVSLSQAGISAPSFCASAHRLWMRKEAMSKRTKRGKKTGFPHRAHAPSRCSYPGRQMQCLSQRGSSSSFRVRNEGWTKTACSWSWSERSGVRDPVSRRSFEADADGHDNDGVHRLARPQSQQSHAERTAAAKARRANANANFNVGAQLGMGVSSVSYEIDDENRRGLERDVTLGFSCRQGKRTIQSQILYMKLTRRVYDVFMPRRSAGKIREIIFNCKWALTLSTPHACTRSGRAQTSTNRECARCSYYV
jgi:hypothetical protein